MKKLFKVFLQIAVLLLSNILNAQQPDVIFQQCYGGESGESSQSIYVTEEAFYVLGTSYSLGGDIKFNHGKADFWLFKSDYSGDIIWEKTYGGSDHEWAKNMLPMDDGGYLLFGSAWSTDGDVSGLHGGGDFWLVRTDSLGNLLWQKCLGGSCNDRPLQLIEAHGGGYICIGSTCSTDGDIAYNHGAWDAWVVRLSETGEIIWEKTYGGGGRILLAQ